MAGAGANKGDAGELIAAIVAKLESNRSVIEQSVAFGRLSWRWTKNGGFDIDLEPRI
ncbi:MAG: hypothetical protein AB7T37_10640 [Dehalococcoidia bacterium]